VPVLPKTLLLVLMIPGLLLAAGPEEVALDTGTGVLAGTLLVPAGNGPFPVALIIAGSGPTDRNGNSPMIPGHNNSLRQLARGLAAAGVASLRYDKRGVAFSMAAGLSEKDLRFDGAIDDARRWCRLLQADPRFSSLTVVGHSEGSQVGANAAWLAAADGFVSVAGPGRPILDVLREQLGRQLPVRSRVKAEEIMSSLEKGRLVEDPPPEMTILFRTSVQPYLISWQKYDPPVDVARFDGPVTIIQGTTDIQVSVHDAELLAEARPSARLVLLEGINHVLKPVADMNPVVQQVSYSDSTLQVSPEAVAAVIDLCAEAGRYHAAKAEALQRALAFNGTQVPGGGNGTEQFAAAAELPTVGERVGFWARRFLTDDAAVYCFGPAEGGYVAAGRLLWDQAHDCVSFMYRCTELARSGSAEEAVSWALRTRFAGAEPLSVMDQRGAVDYDSPEHLDFSLDMIRTGIWGRDVTGQLTGAVDDTTGSSRYPAKSFRYVPTAALDPAELQEGDIVWLVLNPDHKKGADLRQQYGLVIGHLGIVLKEGDQTLLAHAAQSDLEGLYEGGRLVQVPLKTYLERVEKFAGVVVTRP
jgi:fermentation-respiration switch protein FrsA (DUF1100 family)